MQHSARSPLRSINVASPRRQCKYFPRYFLKIQAVRRSKNTQSPFEEQESLNKENAIVYPRKNEMFAEKETVIVERSLVEQVKDSLLVVDKENEESMTIEEGLKVDQNEQELHPEQTEHELSTLQNEGEPHPELSNQTRQNLDQDQTLNRPVARKNTLDRLIYVTSS